MNGDNTGNAPLLSSIQQLKDVYKTHTVDCEERRHNVMKIFQMARFDSYISLEEFLNEYSTNEKYQYNVGSSEFLQTYLNRSNGSKYAKRHVSVLKYYKRELHCKNMSKLMIDSCASTFLIKYCSKTYSLYFTKVNLTHSESCKKTPLKPDLTEEEIKNLVKFMIAGLKFPN
eukprot:GAHX01004958.1.p1 GENE.GAHX01004958.1~~GAHX01004958.1.p1  ORF type:complete len:172 (-),score=19.86 GAHX01004958.1:367-882(-)